MSAITNEADKIGNSNNNNNNNNNNSNKKRKLNTEDENIDAETTTTTTSNSPPPPPTITAATATAAQEKPKDTLEDQNYRYATWKSNAFNMYDLLIHHDLDWPSLCIAWGALENKESNAQGSSGANGLEFQVNKVENEKEKYQKLQQFYFSSRTDGYYNLNGCTWDGHPHMLYGAKVELNEPHTSNNRGTSKFTETKKDKRIHISKRIVHPGEVNKMRVCRQYNNILATHSDSHLTYIWDMDKQENQMDKVNAQPNIPDLTLTGHTDMAEYALAWCKSCPNLLSGGSDNTVIIWSLQDYLSNGSSSRKLNNTPDKSKGILGASLDAKYTFNGHTGPVEDVKFDPESHTGTQCCSVGDDRNLFFWDGRKGTSPCDKVVNAHADDINCVVWNPYNRNIVCTGASDGTIHQYDVRKLSSGAVHEIGKGLEIGNITTMQWLPHSPKHFASADDDGVLYIWDITRVGVSTDMDPISLGSKDLPQEMIFKHMGHRAGVTDFDCNIISPWTFASMSDDGDLGGGTLQLWRVNEWIYDDSAELLNKIGDMIEKNTAKKK